MPPVIVEGMLADIDGVRHGQVAHRERRHRRRRAEPRQAGPRLRRRLPDLRRHGRHPHPCPRGRHRPGDAQGNLRDRARPRRCTAASSTSPTCRTTRPPRSTTPATPPRNGCVAKQNLPVVFTLYAGIGPGHAAADAQRSLQGVHGPERRRSVLPQPGRSSTETLAHYRGQAVSFHCEDPGPARTRTRAPRRTKRAGRPSAS